MGRSSSEGTASGVPDQRRPGRVAGTPAVRLWFSSQPLSGFVGCHDICLWSARSSAARFLCSGECRQRAAAWTLLLDLVQYVPSHPTATLSWWTVKSGRGEGKAHAGRSCQQSPGPFLTDWVHHAPRHPSPLSPASNCPFP